MKIVRAVLFVFVAIGIATLFVMALGGCARAPGNEIEPRRDIIIGVGSNEIMSVPVYIAEGDGVFVKVGRVSNGSPLCFKWPFAGPIGKIASFDVRGKKIVVEFQPRTADAWLWTVTASDWPQPKYGEARCA